MPSNGDTPSSSPLGCPVVILRMNGVSLGTLDGSPALSGQRASTWPSVRIMNVRNPGVVAASSW